MVHLLHRLYGVDAPVACSSQEADAAVIDVTSEEDMEDNRPFLTVNNKRNRDVRRASDKCKG